MERTPWPQRLLLLIFAFQLVGAFFPALHPRVDGPSYVAMLAVPFLWASLSGRLYAASYAAAVICAYGVLIAGGQWTKSLWSNDFWVQGEIAVRHAGGAAWFTWIIVGLSIAAWGRWALVLKLLCLIATTHALVTFFEPWLWPDILADWGGRRFGLTGNPGFLGLWCMAGALVGLHLTKSERRWWLASVPVCLLGLWLSSTEAALAGFVAGLPFVLGKRWAIVPFAAVVGALFWDWSWGDRFMLWGEAWRGFLAQPWGHGFYSFWVHTRGFEYADFPHSLPLQVAYELGVPGLMVGLALLVAGALALRGVWAALGVGWLVYSLFWIPSPGWFLIGAVLLGRIVWTQTKRAGKIPAL